MRVFGLESKFWSFSQVLYRGMRTRLRKSRTLHIAVRCAAVSNRNQTPMKKILTLFLVCLNLYSFGQKSNILEQPKVYERVELLSIVFRLAENPEYSSEKFKLYTDKIYKHYEPYKDHKLIQFVKQLS